MKTSVVYTGTTGLQITLHFKSTTMFPINYVSWAVNSINKFYIMIPSSIIPDNFISGQITPINSLTIFSNYQMRTTNHPFSDFFLGASFSFQTSTSIVVHSIISL